MSGIQKSHIVRIAVERTVVSYLKTSCHIPSLQSVVREFERTVPDKFRIKASVCREVYVFEKYSVHGRLDLNSALTKTHLHFIRLRHHHK